jgi:hypothetical protein
MQRLRARLARSNTAVGRGLLDLLSRDSLGESDWEAVEDLLLAADLGVAPTTELVDRLRDRVRVEGGHDRESVRTMLHEELLALDGRLVQIAVLGGAKAHINMVPILQRRLTITGSTLRARPVAEKGAIARAVRDHVWPLLESGAVAPVVFQTFPLRDAAAAHLVMESSAHIGKLVLVVGQSEGE